MIENVLQLLVPRPGEVAAAPAPNGQATVYLVCDSSAPEDSAFAKTLGHDLIEKEGLKVLLPGTATNNNMEAHQQRLREADGLLLYRNTAPIEWLRQNLADVLFADRLERNKPLKAKAFVLDDPDLLKGYPNVIPRTPQFTLHDLESFLGPLRSGGGTDAHA